MLTLKKPIAFEWDQGNIDKNYASHSIGTHQAEEPFVDPHLIFLPDPKHSRTEKRYLGIGVTKDKITLLVAFTLRGTNVRIISARPANKKERNVYEKQKNA